MSKRSDRKWAAKEQRADAVREDGKRTMGIEPGPSVRARDKHLFTPRDQGAKSYEPSETAKGQGAGMGNRDLAHPPANTEGGNGYLSRALAADRATQAAKASGKAADHEKAASAHAYAAAGASMEKDQRYSMSLSNQHITVARKLNAEHAEQVRQKAVGEAHLEAASIHEKAAKSFRKLEAGKGEGVRLSFGGAAEDHEKQAAEHKAGAAEAAKAAGGEWDEAKHPRDENGKFA